MQTLYIPRAEFRLSLAKWVQCEFSEAFIDVLIFRIDEFGVGASRLPGLDRFVAMGRSLGRPFISLRDRRQCLFFHGWFELMVYIARVNTIAWVIRPRGLCGLMIHPRITLRDGVRAGEWVTVFPFYSTASAKAWIIANEGEISSHKLLIANTIYSPTPPSGGIP